MGLSALGKGQLGTEPVNGDAVARVVPTLAVGMLATPPRCARLFESLSRSSSQFWIVPRGFLLSFTSCICIYFVPLVDGPVILYDYVDQLTFAVVTSRVRAFSLCSAITREEQSLLA